MLAREFLTELASGKPMPADRVAVVVAHPDDETIGCGGTLARLIGVHIAVMTDGAPRDLRDARAYGFESAEAYAAARWNEFLSALRVAGTGPGRAVSFGIPDQEATENIADLALRLADYFQTLGIAVALTHAYEGGHPDHDATACAVSLAAALCRKGGIAVDIVEMPFYRSGSGGEIRQSFIPDCDGELSLTLTDAEREQKTAMRHCYRTQSATLAGFALDIERFRPAPHYNFKELPNGGRLLYEAHDWKMSAERWRDLVRTACARLDEEGIGCRSPS